MPGEKSATGQGSWVRVEAAKVAFFEGAQRLIDELQLRQAELEARIEELGSRTAPLDNILAQTPDPVFVKDLQGRYLAFNPAPERATGKRASEVLGKDDQLVFPPAVASVLAENDQKVIANGVVRTYEERVPGPVGDEVTYVLTEGPVLNDGDVVGLVGIARDITVAKKTQEALRIAEERLSLALLGSDTGVWDWDVQTGELFLTNECKRLFGYSESDTFRTEGWGALVFSEDKARVLAARQDCLSGVTPNYHVEYRAHTKIDGLKWFATRGRVSRRSPDGQALRLTGTTQDITERKQVECELVESNDRYEQLARQSLSFAWEVDANGLYTYVTPACETVLGYRPEETSGRMHFFDLHPLAVREEFSRASVAAMERQEPFQDFERPALTKDGRPLVLSTTAIPLRHSDGSLRGYRGTDMDVTERRAREAEIARLAGLYATLSRVNQCVVGNASREKLFGDVCAVLAEHAGFKLVWVGQVDPDSQRVVPVACAGQSTDYLDAAVFHADDRPTGRGPIGRCIRQGTPVVFNDYPNDPTIRPWLTLAEKAGFATVAAFPLRFDGEVFGALTVYSGVAGVFKAQEVSLLAEVSSTVSFALEHLHQETRRREAELALQEANEKLAQESLVAIRLRDEADRANGAKSAFLADMSHEVRTPMNGVIGLAQLLEFTSPTDEQRQYVDGIKTSANSLLSLVNDVLDLAKVESGKLELEKSDFSLRSAIAGVAQTQITLIHTKGLKLQTSIPAEVPDNLTGDPLRLKQVLLNLLSNAIKFTDKGSLGISVVLEQLKDRVATLKFGVTDSGIGIKPDVLKKIFQPYVQADSSTTRRYGGTGLGLSICTRLAGLMGGRLWAESKEGEGSVFFVQLPFVVNDAALGLGAQGNADNSAPLWYGPPLRILVVDDHKINLLIARGLLAKVGHTVVEAHNGQEAVAQWEQEPFDAILMDIQMPVMSGVEAVRAIRQREKARGGHVPVLALTARAMKEEQELLSAEGFDGYVTKPFALAVLLEELRRCLPH